MGSLDIILSELDERNIARRVGIKHDEARSSYFLAKGTVDSWDEFLDAITGYFSWHFGKLGWGSMPRWKALAGAKEAIERGGRIKGRTLEEASQDARYGTNGGLRGILDVIADNFKMQDTEAYVSNVFSENLDITSWEERVDIVRQFISRCGQDLSSYIDVSNPEKYARDCVDLIKSYVQALAIASSATRR